MKVIIVADGDVSTTALPTGLPGPASGKRALVIAADGGALKAELLGLRPDVVVGDLDSLSPQTVERLRTAGSEIQRHPVAKDESDTQLALLEAVRRGGRELIVLGALGGERLDHGLANVLLLALPEIAGCDVTIVDGAASLRLLSSAGSRRRLELQGTAGDLVSLLPVSEVVEGVRTDGLLYALADEPLWQGHSRGLSNVMQADSATVDIRAGRLAVIHTTRQPTETDHA